MNAIQELEAARVAMMRRMPIGEPAVPLNPKHVLVSLDDPSKLHIRMDHLICMIDDILKS